MQNATIHTVQEEAVIPSMGEGAFTAAFLDYAAIIKRDVDRALTEYFDELVAEQRRSALISDLDPVVSALRALVERGGKRLRGVFLAAAYEACGGSDRRGMLPALVAFELLQAYLLIHDDWMDQDDVRRDGPTVHAALRDSFGERESEWFAVLAGDLAQALSLEALCDCAIPQTRIARAAREMGRILRSVTLGQMLDVRGSVRRQGSRMRESIDTVYELKTAAYTLTGPLAIGAVLAGASEHRVARLAAAGVPLGIMFQLRDDLLGVFGDPAVTGKSASSDLRRGKFTALIVEASSDPHVLQELDQLELLNARNGSPAEIERLVSSMRTRILESGARERIEARISRLYEQAAVAIAEAELSTEGARLLLGGAAIIGRRNQ